MAEENEELGELLRRAGEGDRTAFDELLPRIYPELRRLAHGQLFLRRRDGTLSTTALVHEAWMRLVEGERLGWREEGHFLALVAQAMRHILVDYARKRAAQKRGGDAEKVPVNEEDPAITREMETVIAVDEAFERLALLDPRLVRVVELRYFAGLSHQEVGRVIGVSARTARREWAKAKALLARQLSA